MNRAALFALGLLTLAALWLGPLPGMTAHSFSAHMALHMGLVAVAAALLGLGLAGTRFDPVRRWPALFPPIPLSILELIVVWAWHAPALHHAARHHALGFVAEQGSFLVAGLLVWLSAFGGGPALRAERTGAGIAALLLTSMHMTLLGALLALTPRPLFDHSSTSASSHHAAHAAAADPTAPWPALSPLDDQHLGGAIMLLVGGVAYLAGGVWLTARLLRPRPAAAAVQP